MQTVNARDLHEFLEVTTQFKDWIARRIQDYDLEEGKDFSSFLSESSGGRPAKEYALSLDMAKELCMVERNDKGKQARAYFIECERRFKIIAPQIDYSDPAVMLGAFNHLRLENERKDGIILELEDTVQQLQPAQDALNRIAETSGDFCITDAAKAIQYSPKGTFSYMRRNGWIYQRPGKSGYIAYRSKIAAGLLVHKVRAILKTDGGERIIYQVRVTPKGLSALAKLIKPALKR